MNFIKSIIPNMFYYTGLSIMYIGIYLHKTFNTKMGQRLRLAQTIQRELQKELEATKNESLVPKNNSTFYIKGNGWNN